MVATMNAMWSRPRCNMLEIVVVEEVHGRDHELLRSRLHCKVLKTGFEDIFHSRDHGRDYITRFII